MKKRSRIKYSIIVALLVIVAFFGIYSNRNKLTYIENKFFNERSEDFIEINKNGDSVLQEFTMPYEILYSVSLNVGTFARQNDSIWEANIINKKSGEIYNFSLLHFSLLHFFTSLSYSS